MKEFSQRLKRARMDEGMTQSQMAEALGIPFTTYRNYETRGAAGREPDLAMLSKIADVLGVTVDFLLGRS